MQPVAGKWRSLLSTQPVLAVTAIAAVAVGIELAVAGRYGFTRDELYFIACGHHLSFGYVDQPALTPVLARLSQIVFGTSLQALRILPAICLAVIVTLTAAISRQLGAGRTGQVLAALAAATSGEYLAAAHVLTTIILDYTCWAITWYVVTRLLVSRDVRWWAAVAVSVGVGLDAKWNIGFLVAGLFVGFLLGPSRQLMANGWFAGGVAIALLVGSPDIIWQATHGWPNLTVFGALHGAAGHNQALFWPLQIPSTGIALVPLWVAGLVWYLRGEASRAVRPLGWAAVFVLLATFAAGGKPYYPGGVFVVLFAAGSVPLGRWLERAQPGRPTWRRIGAVTGAMVVSGALLLPIAVPVLPAGGFRARAIVTLDYPADDVNWAALIALVTRQYDSLPASERPVTTLLTGAYGQAAAIDYYGPAAGLPTAYSGNNSYWLWGPPPSTDRFALAIGLPAWLLRREFASVRLVAVLRHSEIGDIGPPVPIELVSGRRTGWADTWPAFRHYA
ncbi:MAG TPA: glycosyltransferase family 39 protein [Acidimicrobiales bacterium]|nr:glycosyltransferase family 39 protein [Acidimicrobiales bacterium]